ncbi:MAG: hypothetical protein M4579_007274, partial [Chaenotheca gracillima]
MRKDSSPLLPTTSPRDSRYVQPNASDISSMPPESLLEQRPLAQSGRTRSRSVSREEVITTDKLKTPSRRRSRSLSKERLTQKVMEKLTTNQDSSSKHKHHSSSRRSSKEHGEGKSRRRSSKSHRDESDLTSGQESSLLTNSQLSGSRRSGDQSSVRSGTSRSSINPRLLEAVDETVRRLILPEIHAMRHEQQNQWSQRRSSKDARDSFVSGSSNSREETSRRVSKMSSAPEFTDRPKVVLNREGDDKGVVLSGDSIRRSHRKSSRELDSPSRKKTSRKTSEEFVTEEITPKSRRHGIRDVVAAGLAGGLTAAALRHHDSNSSVDLKEAERKERRRRRSKSRSRSASISESLDAATRDIPPMPLSSDIHSSELTRQSILTERTERPPSEGRQTPTRDWASPSRTPTRTPLAKTALRMHHSNASRGDLSIHSPHSEKDVRELSPSDHQLSKELAAGLAGAALGATATKALHHDRQDEYDAFAERSYNARRNRGLSPIQSVASNQEDATVEPLSHHKSAGSLGAGLQRHSQASTPTRSREIDQRDSTFTQSQEPAEEQYWYEQHQENDRNRSFNERMQRDQKDPLDELKHLTNYTEESVDDGYNDKVAAGQHVMGIGANPEYRHTPLGVESAVASLHDPSVVDVRSTRSGHSRFDEQYYPEDLQQTRELDLKAGSLPPSQRSSPIKSGMRDEYYDEEMPDAPRSQQDSYTGSPRKMASRSSSEREEPIHMGASGMPDLNNPMPAIGHVPDDESDMTTNPSIIQGPIGGIHHDNRDHWPYEPTPPQSNGTLLQGDHHAAEAGVLGIMAGTGLAAVAEHSHEHDNEYGYDEHEKYGDEKYGYETEQQAKEVYERALDEPFETTRRQQSPLLKDEGYISAANARSPGAITPEPRQRGLDMVGDTGLDDDVFTSKKHARHVSGMSHGMPSPLYDSAMGRGLDRIHSKDVVALMDLLTVRDAQRNARDTEILVTLVRSAAEMRNSFEDMKKLLAEQEKYIVSSTDRNTERSVQKAMHGPRPQPFGTARGTRRSSTDDEANEDLPTKRRNVFRRALKGLSNRSSNDLANIEHMLNQLLGDVEGLKASQELQPTRTGVPSIDSYDNLRTVPEGYEPEGQAGTGSTNQSGSGFFSNTSSRQTSAMRGFEGRRASEHRISTVEEGDEDLAAEDAVLGTQYGAPATNNNNSQLLSPTPNRIRGSSVPLDSPPQVPVPTGAHSNENTPRTAEKSRKHKSTSSSIFPKISRWSETTASSVAKNFRSSGRKEKDSYLDPASRSGSEGDFWNDNQNNQHDPQGADRLRSGFSTDALPEHHPPGSPSAAIAQEDPKYQAHRNSLNLQHPQPRPGHRYQYQLESSAQNFDPISPSSTTGDQWGSNTNVNRYSGGSASHRYSGGGDDGADYAQGQTAAAPPRPPKIPEESLAPKRPPKIRSVDGKPAYPSHLAAYEGSPASQGSPRSASGQFPQRKPTGPRPLSSAGADSPGSAARRARANR